MTPSICSYEFKGLRHLPAELKDYVEFNDQEGYFKISQITDSLAAVGEANFEIVYKVRNLEGNTVVTSYTPTKLTVNNPCLNTDFVRIESAEMDVLAYSVSSGPASYTHDDFKVTTEPIVH